MGIHFHLESPTMKTLLIAFVLLVVTLATAAPAAKQKMAEIQHGRADTPAEGQIQPWMIEMWQREHDRPINVRAYTPAERIWHPRNKAYAWMMGRRGYGKSKREQLG